MISKAFACLQSIVNGLVQPRKWPRGADYDGGSSCTKPSIQADTPLDLLGLPDCWLMDMISFLSPEEQLTLFQTNRACAKIVLDYHTQATCTVTRSTTWKGLRQVLSWIHTPMCLKLIGLKPTECKGISAYDVFLNSIDNMPASVQQAICEKWKFPCVEEVDVSAQFNQLRSLVPRVIAAICPNLQYCRTSVTNFIGSFPDSMDELHPCLELKQLVIADDHASVRILSRMVPVAHHSTAQLVAAFPNLEVLQFNDGVIPFVMEAFSQQISVLHAKIRSEEEATMLRPYHQLRILTIHEHLLINNLVPLPDTTEHLKSLQLHYLQVTDRILEQLLQLPSLEKLTVLDMNALENDYSNRYFKNSISLEMLSYKHALRAFAKLPISSFNPILLSSPEMAVHLPDPTEPDSLTIVQKIATDFTEAGLQISLGPTIKWVVPETANDADAAALFAVASQAVKPCDVCDLGAVTNRPAYLSAVMKWAAAEADTISMLFTREAAKPYIWQLLQQMHHVEVVNLTVDDDVEQTIDRYTLPTQLCDVICCAANHLIEPTFKTGEGVTFSLGVGTPLYPDHQDCMQHVEIMKDMMNEGLPNAVMATSVEVVDTAW